LPPLPPHPSLHPLRDPRDRGSRPRTRLHHTPSHTHITQHQTAPQNTAQPPHNTPLPSCPSTSFTPSPISSPPPPPAPLILPPQTPQNPHLTQPLQPNKTATNSGTNSRCIAIDDGKQLGHQPGCGGLLVGPQRPPLVAPRGQKWHWSLTCDRQSERNTPEHETLAANNGDLGQRSVVLPVVASPSARNELKAPGGAPGSRCLP
jgi:hypothetical protein